MSTLIKKLNNQLQAQKQIFNLMKFDSYPRFLKSEIYKNYLMREISGENITVQQNAIDCDLSFTPNTQHTVSTNNRVILQ